MTIDDFKLEDIYDVAIIRHGFADYVRDYQFHIEANWIGDLAGNYILTFTHCYDLTYKTLVTDDSIKESWDDLFIDFKTWEENNEPEGMVWGTNWSLAYPGFEEIIESEKAKNWSIRLDKNMKEARLQANSFEIRLVYEKWNLKKISADSSTIEQVLIPLSE